MATDVYKFTEDFQLKILALMARDRGIYITYQSVFKPQYFRKETHIDLARIVIDYYDNEIARSSKSNTVVNPPTKEVLIEEIRKLCTSSKIKEKLIDQYNAEANKICEADLSDAEYIKDSIIRFGKKSELEHAIIKSVDIIEKEGNYDEIRDNIDKALQVGDEIEDLGTDYFETISERMQRYAKYEDGIQKVPTGLVGLDNILKGGLGKGELGVIIAPPGRGKSITLTNIGAGALMAGYDVVHYTLEMPEAQVAKRYDCKIMHKDMPYIVNNLDKVTTALLNVSKNFQGKLIIKKYKTNSCSVNTIRSHLTRLYMEKQFVPELIIVDYGDLVIPLRVYKDKRFELESVYLDLRGLGEEFDCPVWTASQGNRGSLSKKIITIADLAEAFNKANIADVMVALCQTDEEKEGGEMRLHIAKHRDGESSITLPADIDYGTFEILVRDADK